MDKQELRILYKQIREKEDICKGQLVFQRLIQLKEYQNAKNILCYVSFDHEVDTHQFINYALEDGKNIIIPYCIKKQKVMIGCRIKNLKDDTHLGTYGILEPKRIIEFQKENIELVILPGIAFSKDGDRLGYGAGYYDKYLADFKNQPYLIGLTYDSLLVQDLPHFSYDIKMNKIITPGKELTIQ